jgi:uncharacterized membrane-anchored protein
VPCVVPERDMPLATRYYIPSVQRPESLTVLLSGVSVYVVNVVAAVGIVVCWLVFVAVWLITANYNESRAPAQRQRSCTGRESFPS